MRAKIRDTEIYFDIDGAGLVPDGPQMTERPVAFLLHGGPGGDHSGFKSGFAPLTDRMQLVYFDHRGQGRSARGPRETYTMDEQRRGHGGAAPASRARQDRRNRCVVRRYGRAHVRHAAIPSTSRT